MKDPIKLIHKFKNNNRQIQYKIYIFLGSLVPDNILNILKNFTNKNYYLTLNTISTKDYKLIEEYYGEYWFNFFFTMAHIKNQIKQIEIDITKKKFLENKYGIEWYNKHINTLPGKKILYSYSASYYNYLLFSNKINKLTKKNELDYRTYNLIHFKEGQVGGDDDDDIEDDDDNEEIVLDKLDEIIEENIDIDDIAKLYLEMNVESNNKVKETAKLISDAIYDKSWEKKLDKVESEYDNSLDNLGYNANIEDIYVKHYILNQYLYKDDTIYTIKQKISVSIPISNNYGNNIKLLPETQYYWSEYEYENKNDQIMLGQKWIRRNELLKIDIIPNENIKIYEKLRYNLSYLKNNFGIKLKREDEEQLILRSYDNYITNNEIYMLDIYNELGLNYNPDIEDKKNLYDVFINIYYPFITFERLTQIINQLNGKNNNELLYIQNIYGTLHNDIKLENEIQILVEETKSNKDEYDKLFFDNYIIQSIIHVNTYNLKNITGTTLQNKFHLYRIFNSFIVNEKYPFIQYQTINLQLIYKLYPNVSILNDTSQHDIYAKWIENAPYGISFKIKYDTLKFISINLYETGRIEYKITWKEEDKATIKNINETYDIVRDLLKKINSENKKIKFILPENENFKYAFINTIQKFKIPEKFKINHNDLSEFSRFFYTYVALVIEPKKRISKKGEIDDISKYGTYLRFKRINNYYNRNKMHLRILYFIRNFNLTDNELIDEISKQFNITVSDAINEYNYVKEKFNKIIKRSKNKSMKNIKLPKSKPPGIGIDIQGRDSDKYKIRITGARNNEQLDEIVDFMKVLIYLYIQTYLYKKKEYQKIKDTLNKLTKIAKRRNKVNEIVDYESSMKTIKSLITLDKARLGFKPEKGQNQWSRSCQNSGQDKKRQPNIFAEDQLEKLLADGYKYNETTDFYEKKVNIKIKNKLQSTIIKAVKLPGIDNSINYFTCDPAENKEHVFIGFLSKSNNPNDLCMPCCFKKNHSSTEYFKKCIGDQQNTSDKKKSLVLGDKLYILQDTNKIQDNRFIYLPKYLDIFFNKLWNHTNIIKNHYLLESKTGYFFKFTIKHDYYFLLSALSNIYDIPIENIIENMIKFLTQDKDDIYFTYLNNGDIRNSFQDKKIFLDYIKTSNYLEYDTIGELVGLPGVISDNGIKYYILSKYDIIIKQSLEKDIIKQKYFLESLNLENYNDIYNDDKDIIFLIKEDIYYFPIYFVKKNTTDKKIILIKKFSNNKNNKSIIPTEYNIINELNKYYNVSCKNTLLNSILFNFNFITKNIIYLLSNKIKIIKQFIDNRYKCKYILLDNGLLLPTKPSGINYNYKYDNINKINKYLLNLNSTLKLLDDVNKILKLDYVPITIFYDSIKDNNINIVSILLNNNLIIPILSEVVNQNDIKKKALSITYQSVEEKINIEIEKYNNLNDPIKYNNEILYDSRNKNIKTHLYNNESYNLFRLELSLFLYNNNDIRDNIINIIRKSNIEIYDKKHELRKILLTISNKKISQDYLKTNTNSSDKKEFITIANKIPELNNYNINNIREYCNINLNDKECNENPHCKWENTCKLQLLDNILVDFINKIIEECIEDGIKFKEIIQENNYYVADIVSQTQYTVRDNQKIIMSGNFNINKLMSELFGKDKIPIIGKRQLNFIKNISDDSFNIELIQLGKQFLQEIISNNDTVIRAYVNSYYWIKNSLYDIESRNLGYFNELQTILTYIFKANIIDFIQNNINSKSNTISHFIKKNFIKDNNNFFDTIINKFRKNIINTDGKIELFILSHLIPIPIIVYDNYSNVKYLYMQGIIPVTSEAIKTFTAHDKLINSIILKFNFDNSNIPKNIYSIYYI